MNWNIVTKRGGRILNLSMMMGGRIVNTNTNQRKKLLVEPEFQKSFLAYTVSIAMVVAGVFFTAIRIFFWKLEMKGEAIGLPVNHIFFQFVREQRWNMDVIFLITSVLTIGILVATGLHLSNRIAGPIYRLKKFLADYRAGTAKGPMSFRENDYFHSLAPFVKSSFTNSEKTSRNGLPCAWAFA